MNLLKFFQTLVVFFLANQLLFAGNGNLSQNYPLSVKVNAEPQNYFQPCPVKIKFIIEFQTTCPNPLAVLCQLVYSDGRLKEMKPITLNRNSHQKIVETWEINQDYSGWIAVLILTPVKFESNKAQFFVKCTGIVYLF